MKIEVVRLKKHFGNVKAVDDISFSFTAGQIFGFIGPNGAGKTTTMRILATLEEPTGGDAFIDGVSVVQDPEKARCLVGYMPDSLPTHRDMTIHDYLDFFARAYGIKGDKRRQVVDSIEEFTNLGEIRHKLLNTLSKGMKQRVSLARALVHNPPIMILDEPAAGLDPRARIELRELLKVLAAQGKAILISSHILTELAEICNGSVIIEHGRLLMAGSMQEIMQQKSTRRVVVRSLKGVAETHKALLQMPYVENARLLGNEVEVQLEGGDETACEVLARLVQSGCQICEFRQAQTNLEDVFMHVTKGEVQ